MLRKRVLSLALSAVSSPMILWPQTGSPLVSACDQPAGNDDAEFAAPYLFGWKLFLAINCPAQNGKSQPVQWETWEPNVAVYLAGGKPPAPWGSPLPPRKLLNQKEIDGYTLLAKDRQPVLDEIRMNRAAFEYIVQRGLYSKAGQLKFFNDRNSHPIDFPREAIEIKAAWLILKRGDPRNSRYYTIEASYDDLDHHTHQILAGLAGLHISSKVLPHWFWTTFEQVDNQETTMAPLTVPIPPDVRRVNAAIHAALPAGSVWRFYNMRGAQIDFTTTDNHSTILSNTLLETQFQKSSSCTTCHGLATRGSLNQGRLAFFQMTPRGVEGYTGALGDRSNHYFDAFANPVCYDGSREAFTDCKTANPAIVYKTMDFVWSLREAQ